MEPCTQEDNIAKLFKFHDEKMTKLHDMEIRQIGIGGDVAEIKKVVSNGLSHKVNNMHDVLLELKSQIAEHADLYKRVKDAGWGLFYAFVGVVAAVVFWAMSKGFTPKL